MMDKSLSTKLFSGEEFRQITGLSADEINDIFRYRNIKTAVTPDGSGYPRKFSIYDVGIGIAYVVLKKYQIKKSNLLYKELQEAYVR